MGRFLLIRHAESVWNAAGRMQGWADPPLSEQGREAARRLGRTLRASGAGGVSAAVSSDLIRARQTAAAVLEGVRDEGGFDVAHRVRLDARLRERDVGWVTGLDEATAFARYPQEMADWRARRAERPPGGEPESSVLLRAGRALDDLAREGAREGEEGERDGGGHDLTLIVSHGGVISILERAAGLGAGGFANLHGCWVVVEGPGRWRLGERFAPDPG